MPPQPLTGMRVTIVGSRRVTDAQMTSLEQLAFELSSEGAQIVTGTAEGADSAAVAGALRANVLPPEIWGPYPGIDPRTNLPRFSCTRQHLTLVDACHPRAYLLDGIARNLHARNIGQVLGPQAEQRSHLLLCATPDGVDSDLTRTRDTGGTGTAISLAYWAGIPVCNITAQDPRTFLDLHKANWDIAFSSFAPSNWETPATGINISSNAKGLGAALTNPTVLAKQKGNLQSNYPVDLGERLGVWPDSESAYQAFKRVPPLTEENIAFNNKLIAWIQAVKLIQNPRLLRSIDKCGGLAWLLNCSHCVGFVPKPPTLAEWTGHGLRSRFLRTMVQSYWMAHSGAATSSATRQFWEVQLSGAQTKLF